MEKKIKQPNPIKIDNVPTLSWKKNHILGYVYETDETVQINKPVFFIATKDKKRIKQYKKIREWLDRAIAYGEQ